MAGIALQRLPASIGRPSESSSITILVLDSRWAHLSGRHLLTSDRRVFKWWQVHNSGMLVMKFVVLSVVVFVFVSVARHNRRVLKWRQLMFMVKLVVFAVVLIFISVAGHNRWRQLMLVVSLVVLIVLRRRGQYGVYGACLGDIFLVRYISLLDTYVMMVVFWKLVAVGNWAGH
jgi:hypothetical protein